MDDQQALEEGIGITIKAYRRFTQAALASLDSLDDTIVQQAAHGGPQARSQAVVEWDDHTTAAQQVPGDLSKQERLRLLETVAAAAKREVRADE